MKTLALHILLILGALLLIGTNTIAQEGLTKPSGRDWIDSLAIKYRIDYIESAMLKDETTLGAYYGTVSTLILKERSGTRGESNSNEELNQAIRNYAYESLARKLRRRTFEKEISAARTGIHYAVDK